ncbi:MAG TPA: TSUP family transporter [Planctomycetota bacterium]|nr:TSUP family transporter [Planctomycetota bacterium]
MDAAAALVFAAALAVSLLTLFTGFGLGTLLLPVFLLLVPPPVAVAATAVVHLLNGVLKAALVGALARRDVLLRFGAAAIPAAFVGAWLLGAAASLDPIGAWSAAGRSYTVTPVGLATGLVMLAFAAIEAWPGLADLEFDPRWLPAGGALSGLFGGLSGHQGAFRAAFLARLGLSTEEFVATSALLACAVDLTRLAVYGLALPLGGGDATPPWGLVGAGVAGAAAGSILGVAVLRKRRVTPRAARTATGALLGAFGALLAAGVI